MMAVRLQQAAAQSFLESDTWQAHTNNIGLNRQKYIFCAIKILQIIFSQNT